MNGSHYTYFKIFLILFGSFWVYTFTHPAYSQNNQLIVIVNPSEPIDELEFTEFKRIIMGQQQRWKNGDKITIALMKTNHPTGSQTAEKFYSMTGNELNKYWLSLVFQGKAKAPVFFNSEEELVGYVAKTPGAIGIVSGEPDNKVKKIKLKGATNP